MDPAVMDQAIRGKIYSNIHEGSLMVRWIA